MSTDYGIDLDEVRRVIDAAEVLVIENGSTDRSLEVANEFASRHKNLRVIQEAQRGKGLAVRRGMLEARGDFRFICDADLSMPIEELAKFLPPAAADFDVAIGSREAPGAVRYNEPPYRHWGGRAINAIIRLLILPGLNDTQCGFKAFTSTAAKEIFRRVSIDGFGFDVEMIYIARKHKYHIQPVAVQMIDRHRASRVRLVEDSIKMFANLFTILRLDRQGKYD